MAKCLTSRDIGIEFPRRLPLDGHSPEASHRSLFRCLGYSSIATLINRAQWACVDHRNKLFFAYHTDERACPRESNAFHYNFRTHPKLALH